MNAVVQMAARIALLWTFSLSFSCLAAPAAPAGSGLDHRSPKGTTPDFAVDPSWPLPLPHHWLLGQIGGLFVDGHDHIWVLNRPRTMTNDEAGLEPAVTGATNAKGQPINGLGFLRADGFGADCCRAAPSILEFDGAGRLLRAWGGPSDPKFIGGRCKAEDGCVWPNNEHGIYVDSHGNVWIGGNTVAPPAGTAPDPAPWAPNRDGGDGFVLKFDSDGNFKLRVGGIAKGPDSNDRNGGLNGTPMLYRPADMTADPKTNRLYIADGYGNRRVLIVDADTGRYLGHFGAYGNNPIDDGAALAQGLWSEDAPRGHLKPTFFRSPVHCAQIANDGKIYVCDRGNNRIQVFDVNDPSLAKPCSNPNGEPGKCGFLTERWISARTYTLPIMPGSAATISFSRDPAQSCLYIGDSTNETIYILNRSNLQELGQFGHSGRMAGDFHWLHQVSTDSRGNIYTSEADTGKRIQKFVRSGAIGCGGTGSETVGGP